MRVAWGHWNLKTENSDRLDELSAQGRGLHAVFRGNIAGGTEHSKQKAFGGRQGAGGREYTSTRDKGLPLTLMMPFPFLQWLTATCSSVKEARAKDSTMQRKNANDVKRTAFFFLPKHCTDWLIMLQLNGDAWVKTFAENAPDDAPTEYAGIGSLFRPPHPHGGQRTELPQPSRQRRQPAVSAAAPPPPQPPHPPQHSAPIGAPPLHCITAAAAAARGSRVCGRCTL